MEHLTYYPSFCVFSLLPAGKDLGGERLYFILSGRPWNVHQYKKNNSGTFVLRKIHYFASSFIKRL